MRLQAIENKLLSINDSVFQNLCDSFLASRNQNYSAFIRSGSQSGKQKTIKGTPDSLFLLTNGTYIFVEYSTNVTAGIAKLKQDLKKCLDEKKTGIPKEQISEIILCVNFRVSSHEIQSLKVQLGNSNIVLSIYTIDSLAIELHRHHRDLVHEYLGLPLDTGQIVSVEKFIEEYEGASNGIATPLNNEFLHRENELQELNQSIISNNFIILTGSPGIGKTKLAIEGIKRFINENISFNAYCISYKHYDLLEDLYQYFDANKDYILFVDDANRIDVFKQIIGFYKVQRKGNLKVIITVRDYALQDFGMLFQEFSPKRIFLEKFTEDQIIDIIKLPPFNIHNSNFHREILRISLGNPRIAIMTALLANAKQDIRALYDLSDLFENYFTTFMVDNNEFTNEFNIKCLGLISIFNAIPYKNREITSNYLDVFGIEYSSFIDAIDKLDNLELIEIQFEHVKIPEQNLSIFFFYRSFIKDDLLSFETLLNNYYENNSQRIKEIVIDANNTFGNLRVMDKLKPLLQNYWRKNKNIGERGFKFLKSFWYYLSDESLEFAYDFTNTLPDSQITSYDIKYENNAFSYNKNNVIELLGEFFQYTLNLDEAIHLAFEYVRKCPEHLPELIHKIRERMTFALEDEQINFKRQTILFQILINGLQRNDVLFSVTFYELAKTFLGFSFRQTRSLRNMSFAISQYVIPNNQLILKFRRDIWEAVDTHFKSFHDKSIELLESYTLEHPDVSQELMEFDVPLLVEIIKKNLSTSSFEHCKYVQDQIRWCKRNNVIHPSFSDLKSVFRNDLYETFLVIDWERYRDKDEFDYDNYDDYQKLKEADIRSRCIFNDQNQMIEFYEKLIRLKKFIRYEFNYSTTLEHIVDENFSRDYNIGFEFLRVIVKNGNEVHYFPRLLFSKHLNDKRNIDAIWDLIQQNEFEYKSAWELAFYESLNNALVTSKYFQSFINTINQLKNSFTIFFIKLKKFQLVEPSFFQIILKTIVEKNESSEAKLKVLDEFFVDYFDELGDNFQLIKKAYIQQEKFNTHFDYNGKGFFNILKNDSTFLVYYVNSLYEEKQFGISSTYKQFNFIWKIDGIEDILTSVFDHIIVNDPYFGIGDHFCNTFFKNLQGEDKEKAIQFLFTYTRSNFKNSEKMNIVVDIARHSLRELYDDILLLFLSLSQDIEVFEAIWWRGNGGTVHSGEVNFGDLAAIDWRNILSIVERSNVGVSLFPIKRFIKEQIENSLKHAELERQRRFISGY